MKPAVRDELDKLLAIVEERPHAALEIERCRGRTDDELGWCVELVVDGVRFFAGEASLLAALEDVRKQWEAR